MAKLKRQEDSMKDYASDYAIKHYRDIQSIFHQYANSPHIRDREIAAEYGGSYEWSVLQQSGRLEDMLLVARYASEETQLSLVSDENELVRRYLAQYGTEKVRDALVYHGETNHDVLKEIISKRESTINNILSSQIVSNNPDISLLKEIAIADNTIIDELLKSNNMSVRAIAVNYGSREQLEKYIKLEEKNQALSKDPSLMLYVQRAKERLKEITSERQPSKTRPSQKERLDIFHKRNDDALIADILTEEKYISFLDSVQNHPKLSLSNQIAAFIQYPQGTDFREFNVWKKEGAIINRGEKAVDMLFSKDGKYNLKKVFDISQTNAVIPDKLSFIFSDLSWEGQDYILEALQKNSGLTLLEKDIKYNSELVIADKTVYTKTGLSSEDKAKALIKEISRYNAFGKHDLKAKSMQYLLCSRHGISTKHIAITSNDIKTFVSLEINIIKESLSSAIKTAEKLNSFIDANLEEIFLNYKKYPVKEQNYFEDSLKHDNEIDLDREKTAENLGFRDNDDEQINLEQGLSLNKLLERAKAIADERNADFKKKETQRQHMIG